MRRIAIFLLVASSCFGQRLTNTFSGWGSVAHPGTGFPVGTRPGNGGYRGGYRTGGYRGGAIAVPYFVGGYGYGGYGYGYGDSNGYVDNGSVPQPIGAPPVAAAPPVIINQYFGVPPGPGPSEAQDDSSVRIYSQPSAQTGSDGQASGDPRTYLIAYKDHSVYTALAYWIEGHTLNYVTPSNTHNQADISLIDVDFTTKLNQDRGMPVNFNR